MKASTLVLASFAGILICGTASAQELPRLSTVPSCFVELPENIAENSGTECGYVTVPQNRSGGADGEIDLPYMKIFAAEPAGEPPVFMLAGGPGQMLISEDTMALFQPDFLGPLFANRDVVLMEQRGTFRSRPSLTCPELAEMSLQVLVDKTDSETADQLGREALETCVSRHEADGVDLASYNNVESAADVNDVRAALGYEKIVFYGTSYSTLLGQFVMRDFPEIIAAAVLDGTETPTTKSWVEDRAQRAQVGLDRIAELCAQQADCSAAIDIAAEFENVFALIGDEPVTVSLPLPEGAPATGDIEVTVGPDQLATMLYGLQTSRYGDGAIPTLLADQFSGGRDALVQFLASDALNQAVSLTMDDESGMVLLMHMAMVCSDDPPVSSDGVETSGLSTYASVFGASEQRNYTELCDIIDVPQLPDSSDDAVTTDVPVLILTGGLDVQTPAFLGEKAAASLPNARNVVFPSGFHAQIANLNRCAISVFLSFVDDPSAELDTSCNTDEEEFPFVLSEN